MQDEPSDWQARCRRAEGEDRAGGVPVHRRPPPGLGDEGTEVFDLALDRVRHCVAAVAPTPAIVVEHGEMLRQFLGGRVHQSPVTGRPAHHDDRRTIAQPVESDGSAVSRSHLVHSLSFLPRPPDHDRLVSAYGNGPKIQQTLLHPSAWKGSSANFLYREFSEVNRPLGHSRRHPGRMSSAQRTRLLGGVHSTSCW